MQFGHEQLDVYQVSIDYVAWAYGKARTLSGSNRHARDQLLRASQSIPLNIAKATEKEHTPTGVAISKLPVVRQRNVRRFRTVWPLVAFLAMSRTTKVKRCSYGLSRR